MVIDDYCSDSGRFLWHFEGALDERPGEAVLARPRRERYLVREQLWAGGPSSLFVLFWNSLFWECFDTL
jgi:hypothetical protein